MKIKEIKEELMEDDSLDRPMKSLIERLVTKKRKITQFWQPMPEWFHNGDSTGMTTQAAAKF